MLISYAKNMADRTPTLRRVSPVQLAAQVRDAITRINRRLRQTRPVGDLTVAQISALQSLDAAGALTPRELADVERVQPPTMTRIIARLEERALIQRTPHPTDGRQVILAPAQAGRELLTAYGRARDEWLANRLASLSAEERDTVLRAADILSRIAKS
jgi:DNA-binding MarR family transcriptional regulator